MQIAIFCLFQCFAEKEYQMESKQNETFARIFFGTNAIQETWSGGQESHEAATRQEGAPQGGGRAPHPHGQPETLLAQLFYSRGFFWSIKNHQKLARQLDSVWYSFSVKHKYEEKTETGTGL